MAGLEDFDAARQLLLACALAPSTLDVSPTAARLAGQVHDWDEFLASVEVHQLRPQAAARLSGAAAPSGVPAAVSARLEASARAHAGRARFMSAELVRILEALRAANIPAVALKGPAFAEFSGGGLTSRELTDLDVLIQAIDIERAVAALSAIGYECPLPPQAVRSAWLARVTWELPLVAQRGAVLLELHWSLSPRWFPAPVTPEDVLATALDREFAGSRVLWPRADELFLIHAADGMKSGGGGIRWVADLVALLRTGGIDWQRTCDIAVRNGGLNSVRVALAVADALAATLAASPGPAGFAIDLPLSARVLSREAHANARLARAVDAISERLRTDGRITGAVAHFRWSLQVADRPVRVAASIGRHVSGPTIADLALMPPEGVAEIPLRMRAIRRRLADVRSVRLQGDVLKSG
jgi:putative nucleotidyltransferase-like protein